MLDNVFKDNNTVFEYLKLNIFSVWKKKLKILSKNVRINTESVLSMKLVLCKGHSSKGVM